MNRELNKKLVGILVALLMSAGGYILRAHDTQITDLSKQVQAVQARTHETDKASAVQQESLREIRRRLDEIAANQRRFEDKLDSYLKRPR